jgi:3-oxoacyl-[acyl-carrier protein] reductase
MRSRSALVTGASRGIGRAVAERFTAAGFDVVAPSREELDLASPDSIAAYVKTAPPVDILVNNAGENKVAPIADLDLADWQRILSTNVTAAFLLIQYFAPRMAERGWGRIVNVSSCYSFLSRAGRVAYSASKGALNSVTRTAALEFGTKNVLVNAVAPGFVQTEMTRRNNDAAQIAQLAAQTALGRLAQPDEIAELVFFLASEQNSYITGQLVVIDGGFSCQ